MPRAEFGTTKHLSNQMKAKGLQRLRWYCQACERQMRDENGFKCHVQSESHMRQMMLIGEDPRKAINDFSNQFLRDFIQLLRTGHGEKKVNLNQFYQEYIANKQHIHMNATKWNSLTEFAKYLGREGICRVDEDEKNTERGGASALTISWIDNSPEALRRQAALRKKERQDRGDEEREQRAIAEQIQKARKDHGVDEEGSDIEGEHLIGDETDTSEGFKRKHSEKFVLHLGLKKAPEPDAQKPPSPPVTGTDKLSNKVSSSSLAAEKQTEVNDDKPIEGTPNAIPAGPTSVSLAAPAKPKNVFATVPKKNVFGSKRQASAQTTKKPVSEAERIMKEELERKRLREERSGQSLKKQRVG